MSPKEYRKSISTTVKGIMQKHGIRYQDVQVTNIPTISVGDWFFAQDEDCDQILKDMFEVSSLTRLSGKTVLIWMLDCAGVFQK